MPRDLIPAPDPFPLAPQNEPPWETPQEKGRRKGVPVIPPREPLPPMEPNPTVAICGACGIELKQVMGYVCSRTDCPVFARITC